MIGRLSATALAKAKIAGLLAVSLTAGGVGGAVALSHVAPLSQMMRDAGATASPAPDGGDGTDGTVTDPETGDATPDVVDPTADPETVDAQGTDTGTTDGTGTDGYVLPDCPADVGNHGGYVSMVARGAPKDPDAAHGDLTSQAARGDCGKPTSSEDSTEPDGAPGKSDGPHGRSADAHTHHGQGQGGQHGRPDARAQHGHGQDGQGATTRAAHRGSNASTPDGETVDAGTTHAGPVDTVTGGTTAHGHGRGHPTTHGPVGATHGGGSSSHGPGGHGGH